ncbi:MAG: HAD-IA family hydrolase, partial [Bacteroidota bacterium]
FPDRRLDFLKALAAKNTHRLLLLSNTNEIHIDYVKKIMGDKWHRFQHSFEGFYLSYEMKKRKPDPEIFQEILQIHGIAPEETLFIDDTKENTDSAAQLGLKTWNLIVGKEDVTALKQHL